MRSLLPLGWGVLAAAPLLAEAARGVVVARARALAGGAAGPGPAAGAGRPGRLPPRRVASRRARREVAAVEAGMPLAADLLAVAASAGLTPFLALQAAAPAAPAPVAAHLLVVVERVAAGEARLGRALEEQAEAVPALAPLLTVLAASERLGAPAGPALSRLAGEGRARARSAALARARTVPVRLLFPLVFLVLPAFVLLTVVPVLLAGFHR